MPLQTRSQAAATDGTPRKSGKPRRRGETGSAESSDAREQPPHESAAASGSGPAISTQGEGSRYTSPEAAQYSRETSASSQRFSSSPPEASARTSIPNRDRTYIQAPPGSQEHMYASPSYKNEQLSRPPRGQSMMDDALDLQEDIAVEDALFPLFPEESPTQPARASPGTDSEGKQHAPPTQSRQSAMQSFYHPQRYSTPRHQQKSPGRPLSSNSRPPPPKYQYGPFPTASPRVYYSGPPSYHAYPPEQQGGEGYFPQAQFDTEEDQIPPPPSSTTKRRSHLDQPPSPQANRGTPEKPTRPSPRPSPFRSPLNYDIRRSPVTPFLRTGLGSFDMMNTPSFQLPNDYSPNLPPFNFGDDVTLPLGPDYFNTGSPESESPRLPPRRHAKEKSPLTNLMDTLSPPESHVLGGVTRSPLRRPSPYESHPPSRERHGAPAVTMSDNRAATGPRRIPHSAQPRNLWPGPDRPKHKFEIGGSRDSLSQINNMMRPRDETPNKNRGTEYPRASPHQPQPHRRPNVPARYGDDIVGTPIKYIPPPNVPSYARPHVRPSPTMPRTPPEGKENKGKKAQSKKLMCNCKKSKCLKLYCECFAAERFCNGCNCVDCGNTPTAGAIREKAIKETKAKNPHAFKPRIQNNVKAHNMGCKCKRSECLKKYCECFQAGVFCGSKCKCSHCQNFAGSQALIDKRRKIKDQRGADFAMRMADEAWKGRSSGSKRGAPPSARRAPVPSPAPGRMTQPRLMHPSPRGLPPPGGPHPPPPPYMGHHPMMIGGPMGYSPMTMPMTPAGYPSHPHTGHGDPPHGMYRPTTGHPPSSRHSSAKRTPKNVTPNTSTPRTPAVRAKFDPASSRKKRKLNPGQPEPTLPIFGSKFPEQPKTTVLAVFSFLSNDEIYNAGLVCKSWSRLAIDEELWKFES